METEDEQEQPLAKTKSHTKRPTRTVTKKAATVLSSESDVDDDELGITPRTPPQSPFYRGHREPTGERRKTSPPVATTSKGQTPHAKKTKQRAEKTPAIDSAKEQQNKAKKKKHHAIRASRQRTRQTIQGSGEDRKKGQVTRLHFSFKGCFTRPSLFC